jgi:hypothetical protein
MHGHDRFLGRKENFGTVVFANWNKISNIGVRMSPDRCDLFAGKIFGTLWHVLSFSKTETPGTSTLRKSRLVDSTSPFKLIEV